MHGGSAWYTGFPPTLTGRKLGNLQIIQNLSTVPSLATPVTTISHLASTEARVYPMDSCTLSLLSHPTLPPTNPGGICGLHASSTLEGIPTPAPIETSGELPDCIIAPRPELIAAKIDPLSLWSSTAGGNLRPHVSNPHTGPQVSTYLPHPRTTPHHPTQESYQPTFGPDTSQLLILYIPKVQ